MARRVARPPLPRAPDRRGRSAYSRLMGQGLTVFHADTNLYGVREARAEIEEVKRRIVGENA
jgi:hypothetical protein